MLNFNIVAEYECKWCGETVEVKTPVSLSQYRHSTIRFNKPDGCSCGNKNQFKLMSLGITGQKIIEEEVKKKEEKVFDIDKISLNMTEKTHTRKFMQSMQELSKEYGSQGVPESVIMDKLNITKETLKKYTDMLRVTGDIYSPKQKHWRAF